MQRPAAAGAAGSRLGALARDLGSGMSTFSLILPNRDPTSTPPAAANEAMSSTPPDLKGLRRRLDEIDDRLQDLLIDRAAIISMVAASKKDGNQPAFQPAREAEIIRRLVGRHHGAFPVASLIRMWREMLAATVRLQSPFLVAVFAPDDRPGFWDLARDHYGSNTPMTACRAAGQVIRAVVGREAAVGLVPLPEADEPDPWWPALLSMAEPAPRILARLPFGARGNARTGGVEALAIGRVTHQNTGRDRTLLAAESTAKVSQAQMLKALSAVGLICTFFASFNVSSRVALIEIEGFLAISDARLDAFRAEMGDGLHRLVPMGGYAVPLPAAASAARG
jgi:chorismate mutase/prephenate dehydratase